LRRFFDILAFAFWFASVACSAARCADVKARPPHHSSLGAAQTRSSIDASRAIEVVEQYLQAGQMADARVRSRLLGEKVFFFGHNLTRQQAERQITSLYHRWPVRKYGELEEAEVFAIPSKRDVYKVTGLYAYDLGNLDERLRGKSRLTCILQRDDIGIHIIGLDEKLVTGTTDYSRD
jgi:hypothetical protein